MSIRTLIEDKARELAGEADVAFMHLHAAASDLTAEIRRELDSLIVGLRPAGSAVPVAAVIAPVLSEPEAAAAPEAPAADPAPVDAPAAPSDGSAPAESAS